MSDNLHQPGRTDADDSADARLVPQARMMLDAAWASPVRNTLLWLAGAILLVIVATAYGQIRLNRWNEPFYDALARRDLPEFIAQLGVFGVIAGVLLVFNVLQRWLGETIKLKLREGLTRDLVDLWMQPRRAFRLASAGPIGVNPDQRMHEDARHLTELSADLGKPVRATADWRSCVEGADIVVEASRRAAPEPMLKAEWIKPGAFVVPYGTMSAVELALTDIMAKVVVTSAKEEVVIKTKLLEGELMQVGAALATR
jgi:hypothetical protein